MRKLVPEREFHCRLCGKTVRTRRRKQFYCGDCRGRAQHNVRRWQVVSVTDGASGGYAFSVAIKGGPTLRGFFIESLSGYVRFPKSVLPTLPVWLRRRMAAPLRRDIEQIVTSGDPRYHPLPGAVTAPAGKKPSRLSEADLDQLTAEWTALYIDLTSDSIADPAERRKAIQRCRHLQSLLGPERIQPTIPLPDE